MKNPLKNNGLGFVSSILVILLVFALVIISFWSAFDGDEKLSDFLTETEQEKFLDQLTERTIWEEVGALERGMAEVFPINKEYFCFFVVDMLDPHSNNLKFAFKRDVADQWKRWREKFVPHEEVSYLRVSAPTGTVAAFTRYPKPQSGRCYKRPPEAWLDWLAEQVADAS